MWRNAFRNFCLCDVSALEARMFHVANILSKCFGIQKELNALEGKLRVYFLLVDSEVLLVLGIKQIFPK
jgi:hypothetical protein